ncbi:MAG: WD40 repeat domain-containing protein [Sulfurimonas sp.]|nr:WD40 repeat domain-containing protein [Sulfurimonas sp.]
MKKIILITMLVSSLFASNIKQPIAHFNSSGAVIDLLYKNGKIYSATDASTVDIFDLKTKKIIKKIHVDKIEDFMGDLVDSKVFSVDEIDGNILILSQSKKGFARVHLHKNNKTELFIDYKRGLSIAKAKFINKNTILLALLGNELISFNIAERKQNWIIKVSGAKFSDFALNEKRTQVVVADESGSMQVHSTKDGKKVLTLEGQNLDNVFQVAYKNNVVATAGQDRRIAIYKEKSKVAYYKKSTFLIYSVGLSPSGKIAAYASDENNNVTLFSTVTKSNLGKFGGNKMTLSNIVFINENEFLVSSNDETINLYSVK